MNLSKSVTRTLAVTSATLMLLLFGPVPRAGALAGGDTVNREIPWIGKMYVYGNSKEEVCSAVMISEDYALTAAHCLYPGARRSPVPASQVRLVFGQTEVTNNDLAKGFNPLRVVEHPRFRSGGSSPVKSYDVALLVIPHQKTHVFPCYYSLGTCSTTPTTQHTVTAYGFGRDSNPSTLDTGEFDYAGTERGGLLFAFQRARRCLQKGDSGGPVLADADGDAVLVGLTAGLHEARGYKDLNGCGYFGFSTKNYATNLEDPDIDDWIRDQIKLDQGAAREIIAPFKGTLTVRVTSRNAGAVYHTSLRLDSPQARTICNPCAGNPFTEIVTLKVDKGSKIVLSLLVIETGSIFTSEDSDHAMITDARNKDGTSYWEIAWEDSSAPPPDLVTTLTLKKA